MIIKCIYLLARRADLTTEACHRTWLTDHGPLVASLACDHRMARQIQSHTIAPEINQGFVAARGLAEPLDGITEVVPDHRRRRDRGDPTRRGRPAGG
jgi:hypothetical protein